MMPRALKAALLAAVLVVEAVARAQTDVPPVPPAPPVAPEARAQTDVPPAPPAPAAAPEARAQTDVPPVPPAPSVPPVLPTTLAADPIDDTPRDDWDRYVRGFRRDHNFALSVGAGSGTWDMRRFGSLKGKKYKSSGAWARFQYSFHLPLWGGFGYMLGSSFGYQYESADKRRSFHPVPALMFPGALIGVVENFSPVVRWSAAFDAYMERLNGLAERDGTAPDDQPIAVTMEVFDFGTFVDFFYDLGWAVRLEGHHRHHAYLKPLCPKSSPCDFPVNANFRKDDEWLGLGLVHHLL